MTESHAGGLAGRLADCACTVPVDRLPTVASVAGAWLDWRQNLHRRDRGMASRQRRKPEQPITVGDRVRAKTTNRVGEVTHVEHDGICDQLTVSYDERPQDEYLTTPAREGAELPRELVDREQ